MKIIALIAAAVPLLAQAPKTPPVDLTGYWVSVVTEDWRYRMIAAPKGDVASVPLNQAGKDAANAWDPNRKNCLVYGAPGLMRLPTRLHITWADANTLKIETDAGAQTRLLHFAPTTAGRASAQGDSAARWDGSAVEAKTTNLLAGYLRRNGVPYSAKTELTEYIDLVHEQEADWLILKSIVHDPVYLTRDFVTSTHFRREPDGAKWKPTPCQ